MFVGTAVEGKQENDMRKAFVGIVVLAGLALGSGCIGVSANKKTTVSPKYQVAVVDDEIYLVDVKKKTAYKVRIEGVDKYDGVAPVEGTTLSDAKD